MHVDRSTDGVGLRGNQCIFKHGDSEVSFRHARRHCLSAGAYVDPRAQESGPQGEKYFSVANSQ